MLFSKTFFDRMKTANKEKTPKSLFGRVRCWVKAGDPIPKTHRKNLPITILLFVIGLFALACAFAPAYGYTNGRVEENTIPFLIIAFICLTPSLYNIWVLTCCWRRVKGYRWSMVPFFE